MYLKTFLNPLEIPKDNQSELAFHVSQQICLNSSDWH